MDTLKVYKGNTSMWLKYKEEEPYIESESKGRDACVFVSLVPSSGGRTYNKDDSVSLALNYWDLSHLLDGLDRVFLDTEGKKTNESGVSIIHNYDGQIKNFRVKAGDDDRSGRPTYGWYLKVGDTSYSIYTSEAETYGGQNARMGIYGYLLTCAKAMLSI